MSYFCNVLSVKEEKDTTATRQWDAAFTDGGFRLVWVKWEGMRQRHLFSFIMYRSQTFLKSRHVLSSGSGASTVTSVFFTG
jgi:hypothetical protein